MSVPRAPLLLALETATPRSSVALVRGEVLVAARALPPGVPVSAALLPAVAETLAGAAVALADVEAFALSIGPGSFTGLRVGLATLKGLAFGSGRPAVAVPTLAALAAGAPAGDAPLATLLDAQRGEVYAAAWERAGADLRVLLPEGLYRLEELCPLLPGRVCLLGDGALLHAERLRERLGPGAVVAGHGHAAPQAADVARLGALGLAAGQGADPAALVPRYLRRAEAEARRTGRPLEAPAGGAPPSGGPPRAL